MADATMSIYLIPSYQVPANVRHLLFCHVVKHVKLKVILKVNRITLKQPVYIDFMVCSYKRKCWGDNIALAVARITLY